MKFDVIVMLIFLATLPQTLKVIFSMEIALHHHRFCDFKYSNLEWECSNVLMLINVGKTEIWTLKIYGVQRKTNPQKRIVYHPWDQLLIAPSHHCIYNAQPNAKIVFLSKIPNSARAHEAVCKKNHLKKKNHLPDLPPVDPR